jgi:predicted nucleic acid-binding protein
MNMDGNILDVLLQVVESAPHPMLLLEGRVVRGYNDKAEDILGKVWKGYDLSATLCGFFADMLCSGTGKKTVDYDVDGISYCFTTNQIGEYNLIYALPGRGGAGISASQLHAAGLHIGVLLQTQLNVIQRLKRSVESDLPLLDDAYQNALRLLRQARHMTEYAQYISGQKLLMEQDVDIATVIEETVTRLRKKYGTHRISFQNKIPHSTIIGIDLVKFELLFLNLISNALKFSVQDPVTVQLTSHENYVSIVVINSCSEAPVPEGLPNPSASVRLLNEKESTGYGLALVSQITQLHKGWLQINQEDGQVRVSVTLPWRKGSGQTVSQPDTVFDDTGGFSKLSVEMSDIPE